MARVSQKDLFLGQNIPASPDVSAAAPAMVGMKRPIPRTNRGVTPSPAKSRHAMTGKALKPVKKNEVLKKVDGCICTVTEYERQENKACPVHKIRGVKP
jgi:hypothetical protein